MLKEFRHKNFEGYMEEEKIEVKTSDLVKHYLASLVIYGIIFLVLTCCPLYYETIENEPFDYTRFFGLYFVGYMLLAPIFLAIFKPKSVLQSRGLAVFNYIARQFKKQETTEDFLKNLEPLENEKQAFMILFVQSFFGVYCINTLCNKYLLNFGYNIDFIKVMFEQAIIYAKTGSNAFLGTMQFLVDTGDMWIKLLMTLITSILAISYLSELSIFRNKIKSVDTTPLGVLSCIMCYYPITILTNKFLYVTQQNQLPVNNPTLLAFLNLFIIIAHIGMLLAILRLGTKAGNLTNRGIVTGFPYNIVRHPDYSMQIFYIILTTIPLLILPETNGFTLTITLVATAGWIYLYYLRAVTEERHLINDPKYKEYVQKVKHRFIPWII